MQRVTQSDIARAAGVHNTTVSLALRNNPAIPLSTREKIHAVAAKMGYCPDPSLQALVAYRNASRSNRREQTIAYVTNWGSKWGWRENATQMKFFTGAQRKATSCGIKLEHFWFGEDGMSESHFSRMLYHRGISGVILASHREDSEAFAEMDWSRLSGVKIGRFPHAPGLHSVGYDESGIIRTAIKRIVGAGYERIGLVVPSSLDALADQSWSSAFFGEQFRLPSHARVPILQLDLAGAAVATEVGNAAAQLDLRALADWVHHHRPEVVVSIGGNLRKSMAAIGLRVPEDLAYVDAFADRCDATTTGLSDNGEEVGEFAVELLFSQLQHNIYGIPKIASSTVIGGLWRDGETLPRRVGSTSPCIRHFVV